MKKKSFLLFLVLLMVFKMFTAAYADTPVPGDIQGNLVIVGGALESSNKEIYNKFIELAGGSAKAKFGIIGAASSKPVKYSMDFKNDLMRYSVPESNIEIIPIAVKDDKTTKDMDESTWIENVNKPEVAAKIKEYTGIWFVGGDQTRITQALYNKDGSNTLALDAIWEVYKNGGVIGGTSAGAAIMSNPMIAGGSSLGALNYGFTDQYTDENDQEAGPVYVTSGLGFFKYGIVDQHFDRKARLGRLIIVTYQYKDSFPVSYGIDENTAMVVYNQKKTIEAVGRGGVTIVDVTKAVRNKNSNRSAMKNILISYIEQNDRYNWETKEYTINPVKDMTNGYEYYDIKNIVNTGVFSSNSLVKNFITYDLVDNVGADTVKSYCFDENGKGVELIFRKDADTRGYWAYIDGIVDHYSAVNVILDINPINVKIEPAISEYTIKDGDVLWKIANRFRVELEKLIKVNGLKNPNKLISGQKLIIPLE